MRKLKLNLEHLLVESFEVRNPGVLDRGTVHGQAKASDPRVCETHEVDCNTLHQTNCASCNQTCAATCVGQYTCNALATCDLWACSASNPLESGCLECTGDWTCGTW